MSAERTDHDQRPSKSIEASREPQDGRRPAPATPEASGPGTPLRCRLRQERAIRGVSTKARKRKASLRRKPPQTPAASSNHLICERGGLSMGSLTSGAA